MMGSRIQPLATALLLVAGAAHADPKRDLPDYDGRGPEPTTAGDVLLWVPRVALFPLYATTELLVRQPIGAFTSYAELHGWPDTVYNFFTFDEHRAGLIPTAFVEFGLSPSVGLFFFANDAFAEGNDIRAHVAFGGPSWLGLSASDTVRLGPSASLAVRGSFSRRADRAFWGIGPESRDELRATYADQRYDAGVTLALARGLGRLTLATGVRGTSYTDATTSDVEARIAAGDYPAPPGWDDAYTVLYQRVVAGVDSRTVERATGVRAELRGETAVEPGGEARRWIRWGGALGASYDLTGHQRVVSLGVDVDMVDPLDGATTIPFIEQVTFGGEGQMRGFAYGRLVGRSGAAATLSYKWPVWAFLDGQAFFSVGDVFGAHLSGLEPDRLRMSWGLGVRSNAALDGAFEILVGMGTETFGDGARVESVRVLIGAHHGF